MALRGGADVQLLAASAATGVAGALFVIVGRNAIGLAEFAPVAQLWTVWSVAAASLLFAYQQWAIRLRVGRSVGVAEAFRGRPTSLLAAASLGTAVAAFATRAELFRSEGIEWPLLAGLLVAATVVAGTVRGMLAVGRRHGLLAIVIAGDNVLRIAAAAVLIALDASAIWWGVVLVASYAVLVLGAVPGRAGPPPPADDGPGGSTLGSAAIAGFLAHIALAGPPILIALNGADDATVSTLFLALTAIRLPHLLLQAGAPRAAVLFQEWVDADRTDLLARARIWILGVSVAVAAIGAGVGAVAGDLFVGTLFKLRGEVSPAAYALLAAAGVLSVGGAFATVLLVARGHNRLLVSRWSVALAIAVAVGLATGVTGVESTAAGLVVLHLVVLGSLSVPAPDQVPLPSPSATA